MADIMQLLQMMQHQGNMSGAAGGLGQLFGGLFSKFHQQPNPMQAGNQYYNQIPGQLHQGFDPLIQAGQGAMNNLQGEYGKATNDPNAIYNKLAGGYKESPGYQYALKNALSAGNSAAAAGGMLGSPAHQSTNMNLAQDVASKDFNNYLNSTTGIYNQGLSGQNDIFRVGAGAQTDLSSMMANLLGMQGTNAMNNQINRNTANSQSNSDIFGGLSAIAPLLMQLFGMH